MKIRTKVFFVLCLFAIIILTPMSYILYRQIVTVNFAQMRNNLISIASSAALIIDDELHSKVVETKDVNSYEYQKLRKKMLKFMRCYPDIECIYTMIRTEDEDYVKFIIDAVEDFELDEAAEIYEMYNVSLLPKLRKSFQGATADKEVTKDRWGTWLSAYAPILNDNDDTVAIIGVDVSIQTILNERRRIRNRIITVFIFSVFLSMFTAYFISKSITKTIVKIIDTTKLISQGKYDVSLEINRSDEIGQLVSAINDMSKNIKKTIDKLTTLKRTAEILAVTIKLDESLKLSINIALEILNSSKGIIILFDDKTKKLYYGISQGIDNLEYDEDNIKVNNNKISLNISAETIENLINYNNVIDYESIQSNNELNYFIKWFNLTETNVAVPFVSNQMLRGFILLSLSDADKEFVHTFINQIALSLENARLYHDAIIDGLTKLYVRRFFEIQLVTEMQRVKRYKRNLSVLMLDIDYFKNVNDFYGHLAGDYVLREIADILKSYTRNIDVVSRYGGEEIIILLPECEIEGAKKTAERIRAGIQNYNFEFNNFKIDITVSIGVTTFSADSTNTLTDIIHHADTALYKAKKSGRNFVSVYK